MNDNQDPKTVKVSIDNRVAVITLNCPERRNSFDDEMIDFFVETLKKTGENKDVRAAVITGKGSESFCAGYNINSIDPNQSVNDPLPDDRFERAVLAIKDFPVPIVAALNGDAHGGGLDLALACDFRIAHDGVRVAMTPCRLGLVYSASGIKRFVSRLGTQTTRLLFLTARRLPASAALGLGIIDEIVDQSDVTREAVEWAFTIAENAPLAIRGTRRMISLIEEGQWGEFQPNESIEKERLEAFKSNDLKHGLNSFKNRIVPTFQGK